jgi:hypothetical protein
MSGFAVIMILATILVLAGTTGYSIKQGIDNNKDIKATVSQMTKRFAEREEIDKEQSSIITTTKKDLSENLKKLQEQVNTTAATALKQDALITGVNTVKSSKYLLSEESIPHPDASIAFDGAMYRADGKMHVAVKDQVLFRDMKNKKNSIQIDVSGDRAAISNPNGQLKIGRQGIMFGGPNTTGQETSSAQISAGLHQPNSLNIVGMSRGTNRYTRRVDVWSEGGMNVRGRVNAYNGIYAGGYIQSGGPFYGNTIQGRDFNASNGAFKVYGNYPHYDNIDGAIYRGDGHLQVAVDDMVRFRNTRTRDTGIQLDLRKDNADITKPNGQMKIGRQGIMFGGPNATGRETNSAQISAGLHQPDSLNIMGMSSDGDPKNRRIDVWAEKGMHLWGKLHATEGVRVTKPDAGPLIENNYGSNGERYGIGQFSYGQQRMYAGSAYDNSAVALSFAKSDGGFKDTLKCMNNGDCEVDTKLRVTGDVTTDGKLCVKSTCISEEDLKNAINAARATAAPPTA